MTENTKRKGVLILEKIEFDRVFKRKVGKNNTSSGKISLPYDLIGKTVFVVLPEE